MWPPVEHDACQRLLGNFLRHAEQSPRPAWARPICAVPGRQQAAAIRAEVPQHHDVVLLQVKGPLGAQPELVLRGLMEASGRRLGCVWTEAAADSCLDLGFWHMLHDPKARPSGAVTVRLDSPVEAQRVVRGLDAAVLNIAGHGSLLEAQVVGRSGNEVGHRGVATG